MESDFGFAFNDSNSSDRILLIEIVADPTDGQPEPDGCRTIADWAEEKTKRCRLDATRKGDDTCHSFAALDIDNCPVEQPDVVDDGNSGLGYENPDEEELPMIKDSTSGEEAKDSDDDSTWSEVRPIVLRVKTLHISSSILAERSTFFYKLFSNGMMESEQRHVTLRITASEDAALMDLLNFMYSNILYANTATALVDVLMAADKFEVASCTRYCSLRLRSLPMSPESALLYLELPSSVLMADAVQPLTDAAKQFLAARYKDISKYEEEIMNLPLVGIEAILASNDLEDAVYDLVLNWARIHYPSPEDRRVILRSHLGLHIRFPLLTIRKLKEFHTCPNFDPTKSFLDALFL